MTKMTAVIPRTKKPTSRIAKAGVETGAKMLGVGARSAAPAAAATADRLSAIIPAEAARVGTPEI